MIQSKQPIFRSAKISSTPKVRPKPAMLKFGETGWNIKDGTLYGKKLDDDDKEQIVAIAGKGFLEEFFEKIVFATNETHIIWKYIEEDEDSWRELVEIDLFLSQIATYTNQTPVPQAIGGISEGETFDDIPLTDREGVDMWTKLLYPFISPQFTSFYIIDQAQQIGYGDNIPQNVTFLWDTSASGNIVSNTIKITVDGTTIVENHSNDTPRELAADIGSVITKPWGSSCVFTISALTTKGTVISRNFVVTWSVAPTRPSFSSFRLMGLSSLVLQEYETTPDSPLFSWVINHGQYVDLNRGLLIRVLPSTTVGNNLSGNSYQSSLAPISGSGGQVINIRIQGYDVIDRAFFRDIKISWLHFSQPVIQSFASDASYLEHGDSLDSPTLFSWTIQNHLNIEPYSLRIIRKAAVDVIFYQDTSDNHHQSGISFQSVSHNPITHNEDATEFFELQVTDLSGELITKTLSISWHAPELEINQVAVNVSPHNTAAVSGTGTYTENSPVEILVTPIDKAGFIEWQIISGHIDIPDIYSPLLNFQMPATGVELTAIIQPPITINVVFSHQNKAKVKTTNSGIVFFNSGTVAANTISNHEIIIQDPLYVFSHSEIHISAALQQSFYSESFNFQVNISDITIYVYLTPPKRVFLTQSAPGVAALTGAGHYTSGNRVDISLTMIDNRYEFLNWSVLDDASGTVTLYNPSALVTFFLNMPENNVTIQAVYKDPFTLSLTRSHINGRLRLNGVTATSALIKGGESTTIIIDNLSDHIFLNWNELSGTAGINSSEVNPVTFVMPESELSVKAMLEPPGPDYVYHGSSVSDSPGQDVSLLDQSAGKINSFTTNYSFMYYLIFSCPDNIHDGDLLPYQPTGGLQSNFIKQGTQSLHGKTYNVYVSAPMMGAMSNAVINLLY